MEYCHFLQSSETIGKTCLKDTKDILLVFGKRFLANFPGVWSVLLVSAKFSKVKIILENNCQFYFLSIC